MKSYFKKILNDKSGERKLSRNNIWINKLRNSKLWNNKFWKHKFWSNKFCNTLCLCMGLAFVLNFAIEAFSRRSVFRCMDYLMESPMVFFYNVFMIFTTLSVVFLVKRRAFVCSIICVVWLGLGITNGMVLGFRTTPFTVMDLSLADAGLSIITNYLSPVQIALLAVAIVLVLAIFALIFIFVPQYTKKVNFKWALPTVMMIVLLFFGLTNLGLNQKWLSSYFGNLGYAYSDYGFPYCFANTWLNTGIKMPLEYSQSKVEEIFEGNFASAYENYEAQIMEAFANETGGSKKTPNVIFIQMESFFDPTVMEKISFSEDPVPFFRELKKEYTSGYLTVPSVGAGTANTEFEVLSGMSVRFFGPGEYPYKTVLLEEPCETAAYDLKELGYASHAIHNHRGAFYGRNEVYKNLGFDTFTSIEYMNNVEKTPKNWAKDSVLTDEIMASLQSTASQDFVFTVSVQGHGKYPEKEILGEPKITVQGEELSEKNMYAIEYYVNQLKEMDDFLKELTQALSAFNEKTVLVVYGDHLPSLEIDKSEVKMKSVYKTEYVMWSNFPMKEKDQNLRSYQLMASVFERLEIDNGVMSKFHQKHNKDSDYIQRLKMLQYDMLYGDRFIYGSQNPFTPTNLKMGIRDIKISDQLILDGHMYIKGENFTPYSKISVNGETVDTVFLDPQTLRIPDNVTSRNLEDFSIRQIGKGNDILSETE